MDYFSGVINYSRKTMTPKHKQIKQKTRKTKRETCAAAMLGFEMRRNCLPQPPKTKDMSSIATSSTFTDTNASISSSPGKIVSVGSGRLQNGSDMMALLNSFDDANRNLMNEIKEVFVSNKRQITVENRSEEKKDTNNSSKKPKYSLKKLINIRKES